MAWFVCLAGCPTKVARIGFIPSQTTKFDVKFCSGSLHRYEIHSTTLFTMLSQPVHREIEADLSRDMTSVVRWLAVVGIMPSSMAIAIAKLILRPNRNNQLVE